MSGRGNTDWCEAGIPGELRALRRWVAWRYVVRHGRVTKVPICARTRGAASTTDPTTWGDYATAARYARSNGCGVGIVLGDGLVGVDLDHCITDMGELVPWARDIVEELHSYTETSPSGRGVHVLGHGALPGTRRRSGQVEMYDWARFFCVSGRHLPDTPDTVEEVTEALAAVYHRVFGASAPAPSHTPARAMLSQSDAEIIERAMRARNGHRFARLWEGDTTDYGSRSEADLALCAMLVWYTDDADQIARLVPQSGLARAKWERTDYRERTIAAALAGAGTRRAEEIDRCARITAAVMRELGL